VFSYVVLGAGFFTTQKSQQVVHAGVTQAASNIVVKGNVYGLANAANTSIAKIQFDLGLAAGGLPVDVSKITMTFSSANITPYNMVYNGTSNGYWNVTDSSMSASPLLMEGQFATVLVTPRNELNPRETFNLEIKPENGAALGLDRSVPAGITATTLLY
jgi:archaeal flagellin FlaB